MRKLTRAEREALLGEPRIGILGVAVRDGAPLLTPTWFVFRDGAVHIASRLSTRKVRVLAATPAPRASYVVQREGDEPAYVAVEGPARIVTPLDAALEREIVTRYLPPSEASRYLAAELDDCAIVIEPDTWRTAIFD